MGLQDELISGQSEVCRKKREREIGEITNREDTKIPTELENNEKDIFFDFGIRLPTPLSEAISPTRA